jgi:hypothetical protein
MKRLIILLALTCASCQEKAKPRPAVIEGERTPFEGFVVDKKYEKNKGDHGWVLYYKDETKMTSHVKVYEKWVTEVKVGDKIFGYIEFGKSIATKYEAGKPPQKP